MWTKESQISLLEVEELVQRLPCALNTVGYRNSQSHMPSDMMHHRLFR